MSALLGSAQQVGGTGQAPNRQEVGADLRVRPPWICATSWRTRPSAQSTRSRGGPACPPSLDLRAKVGELAKRPL
ncbi:MAG: hypothetical protein RBU37_16620, partial [Myxococcota bacterium]|nr:hypothetical protein [Myxococcota bacterium]